MAEDFKDRPAHVKEGSEILYQGSTDAVYDEPVFKPGDRVEFTADYPSSSNRDNLAAAGDTAEVVGIAPTRDPLYLVKLDSKPDAKWPLNVSGKYLAPEGSGLRGKQETSTVLIRGTGELRRF